MDASYIGDHTVTLEVRFPGSDTVLKTSTFILTIDPPYCGYLSFDADVEAYQPTDMIIGFDAPNSIATYGTTAISQAIPMFYDNHGFVAAGYCITGTDLELSIYLDNIIVHFLEVIIDPNEIILSVPNDASDDISSHYVGVKTAKLSVRYEAVTLFTKEFTVIVDGPDCSELIMIDAIIPNLELTLGTMTSSTMVIPTVDDSTGYLSYGLCREELSYSVEFEGGTLPWMTVTETHILVTLPVDTTDIADYAGPANPWTFLVTHTVTGTLLLENEFVLDINSIPCSELVLSTSDDIVDMDIVIGLRAVGED